MDSHHGAWLNAPHRSTAPGPEWSTRLHCCSSPLVCLAILGLLSFGIRIAIPAIPEHRFVHQNPIQSSTLESRVPPLSRPHWSTAPGLEWLHCCGSPLVHATTWASFPLASGLPFLQVQHTPLYYGQAMRASPLMAGKVALCTLTLSTISSELRCSCSTS